MSDISIPLQATERKDFRVRYVTIVVVVVVVIAGIFFANKLGYDSGYRTAYASEHSHFLFEKSRGDKMHKRIALQQKCVATTVSHVPRVTDGGFAGVGEMMSALGQLFGGSVRCDREAGFGTVTPEQYRIIMGRNSL